MLLTREQEVIRDTMRAIAQACLWCRAARAGRATPGGVDLIYIIFNSAKRRL